MKKALKLLPPRLMYSALSPVGFLLADAIAEFLEKSHARSPVTVQYLTRISNSAFVDSLRRGKMAHFLEAYDMTTNFTESWKKAYSEQKLTLELNTEGFEGIIVTVVKALGLPNKSGIFGTLIYQKVDEACDTAIKLKASNANAPSIGSGVSDLVKAAFKITLYELGFLLESQPDPAVVVSQKACLVNSLEYFKAAYKQAWKGVSFEEIYKCSPENLAAAVVRTARAIKNTYKEAASVKDYLTVIGQYLSKRYSNDDFSLPVAEEESDLATLFLHQVAENTIQVKDYEEGLKRLPSIATSLITGLTVIGNPQYSHLAVFGVPIAPVIQFIHTEDRLDFTDLSFQLGTFDNFVANHFNWEILESLMDSDAGLNIAGVGASQIPFSFGTYEGDSVKVTGSFLETDGLLELRDATKSFCALPLGQGFYSGDGCRVDLNRTLIDLPIETIPEIIHVVVDGDSLIPTGTWELSGKKSNFAKDEDIFVWKDEDKSLKIGEVEHKFKVKIRPGQISFSYTRWKDKEASVTWKSLFNRGWNYYFIKNDVITTYKDIIPAILPCMRTSKYSSGLSNLLVHFCNSMTPVMKSKISAVTKPLNESSKKNYLALSFGCLGALLDILGIPIIPIKVGHIMANVDWAVSSAKPRISASLPK